MLRTAKARYYRVLDSHGTLSRIPTANPSLTKLKLQTFPVPKVNPRIPRFNPPTPRFIPPVAKVNPPVPRLNPPTPESNQRSGTKSNGPVPKSNGPVPKSNGATSAHLAALRHCEVEQR
eukprot:1291118-Rhodomonas_salina.1